MKGILCSTTAKTNEEYKKVVRHRINNIAIMGLIGAVTITAALLAEFYWKTSLPEYMTSVYLGLGVGFVVASVILIIKNMRMLGNEEKLKESRLINSDERIQYISNRAFRCAALIMIVFMYLIALIGGFFYPILIKMLMLLICIFLMVYVITYRIYDKRM